MRQEDHNIYFNTRDELTKVCLDDVMYVTSNGNYITIKLRSGRDITLLASLQNFMQITESITDIHFERVGRANIINTAYVSQVNSIHKSIVLADDELKTVVELIVPKEAIRQFKQLMTESLSKPIPDFNPSNSNMEAYRSIG